MPVPVALGIGAVLLSLGTGLLALIRTIFLAVMAQRVAKLAVKAVLIGGGVALVVVVFRSMRNRVESLLDSAMSAAISAGGSLGDGWGFAMCMMPDTLPDALAALGTIVLSAITVRIIIMAVQMKVGVAD